MRLLQKLLIILITLSRTDTLILQLVRRDICIMGYSSNVFLTIDDHSRVRLQEIPNVPGSDYINASFTDVSNV